MATGILPQPLSWMAACWRPRKRNGSSALNIMPSFRTNPSPIVFPMRKFQRPMFRLSLSRVSPAHILEKKFHSRGSTRSYTKLSAHTLRLSPRKESLGKMLRKAGLKSAKIIYTEHHLAHLLSARFLAPADDIALMSFDGLGDFTSRGDRAARRLSEWRFWIAFTTHTRSDFFYTAMTQYLGFPHFGDEFKVMGLSSYGEPRYLNSLRELIREDDTFGFRLNLEAFPLLKNPIDFRIEKGQPKTEPFYNRPLLTQIIGLPQRKAKDRLDQEHRDLAKSVQLRFEEIANHMLETAAQESSRLDDSPCGRLRAQQRLGRQNPSLHAFQQSRGRAQPQTMPGSPSVPRLGRARSGCFRKGNTGRCLERTPAKVKSTRPNAPPFDFREQCFCRRFRASSLDGERADR